LGRGQGAGAIFVGSSIGGGLQPQALTNLPYSGTRKVTSVQKLANGVTITRTSSSKEARDSQGRTMSESKPMSLGEAPPEADFTHVIVMDPVAHTRLYWSNQVKQANLIHMPDLRQLAPPHSPSPVAVGLGGGEGSAAPVVIRRTPSQPRSRPEIHTEKLGGKLVGNVYAEGVRITTTIPIGMVGNDQPLVTTTETWTSPDLKLVVLSTNDDPRTGLRTEELIDLNRNEPPPSLFQVPAGYTIKEQGANQPQ